NDKRIWVGTQFDGVLLFNPNGQLQRQFHIRNFQFSNKAKYIQYLTNHSSTPLVITRNNVFTYNLKHNQWNALLKHEDEKFLFVSSLSTGRVLMSSDQGMLELVDSIDSYSLVKAKEFLGISGVRFTRVFEGRNYVYIPYNSNELWIYQQKNKELIKKKSIPLKAEFYNFVEIAGRTLFATSRGILELDIDSLLLKEVEPELTFALNNHTPYDLLEDKNSDLWIPTNKTLVRYNLETKEAATFRKEDGFISTEFSDYMKNLVASDGKIWLGTNKGVVVFHPDSIQPYPYPPNPYIDGLKVNNEPYQGKVVAGEAEAITLDYRQNTLELDLLAIGYYLPKEST
ncbi:MAG: hypothetical protein AAFO82_25110, partial [Bacteroidota bacterium]